ncbi:LysR family transcriptional regulator [Pseudomonas sp. efr-133-TYG-103a]|uniref:LysR family transcriptional regulator n=1 Tax=Pseudomonas sp. efr-133-TYG-103a TaxID=3040308 RepID=UPI0025542A46|nr:LysR family transcriptional regulator [Pseudomonas sp. efr-133-TYG-103a]
MDTKFLNSFVAVVESGSIAGAARRLNLAPTTITQQMKALEVDIGCELLMRVGRTVKPTVVGARIVEQARDILRGVRDLRSAASDTALPAGPLLLGATPTALMGLLPAILRRWMGAYPATQIFIEPGTSATLLQRVMSGQLDAAIIVHPSFPLDKTFAWQSLREEPLILLTPSEMKVHDPLHTASREHFIQYDRNVVAGRMADDYLRSHNIQPKVLFELDGIEHIAQLVAEGFGVSILPDWPVMGPPDTRTKRWRLPGPCPSREVGLIWLRQSARSPLARALFELTSCP